MNRLALALLSLLAVLVVALPARAEEVTASVEPGTVELGGTFRYMIAARAGRGGTPSAPEPGALPAGFAVLATSTGSSMQFGARGQSVEVQTIWTVRAGKLGTFTVGPGSFDIGGKRQRARAVKVTVVPAGKAPKPPPDPFDPLAGTPFDPFTQRPGTSKPFDPFEELFREDPRRQIPTDPRFALDQPRAPKAFLQAVVDKTRVVVGEQVTLSVYLYSLPDVNLGRAQDVHVPQVPDFQRRPLVDAGPAKHLGRAPVGDRAWDVELVLKDALFPVKAGKLVIGPMSMVLTGARVGYRESQPLTVEVAEPPLAARPAGYAVGDVGDYALSASVSPRKATRGESVGVQLELRGTGNLPAQLLLPEVLGVEWLDAQTKESIGAEREDRIGGTRTFTYVVRIDREGPVDLGEVKLPYWHPEKKAYGVARASLGIVDMAKGGPRRDIDAGARDEERVLPDLPKARTTLEGQTTTTYLTEARGFWTAIFGAPLGCAAVVVLGGAARRARERRKDRAPDPARVAKKRAEEAEVALAGNDGGAALGAVAKALVALVAWRTGVNVRGATGSTLARELEDKGIGAETAREITEVLRACEDARFSPSGVGMQDARNLGARLDAIRGKLGEARR